MPGHSTESPAKKQSKWSAEEDSIIIELRGSGMKWDDISKRLPGRSAISCRLHYQNYLERRSEWDEERKNKLARLYERFKPEMWAKVAEEMQVPWRAAEAMHWQLGENEMARRAGVVPFSLSGSGGPGPEQSGVPHRVSPSHSHAHSQPQSGLSREHVNMPTLLYGRRPGPSPAPLPTHRPGSSDRPMATRREGIPPSPYGPPPIPEMGFGLAGPAPPAPGPGLPPIHMGAQGRGMLPSVAELTTGISPYSTPAYSSGPPLASPTASATASPNPFLPAVSGYPPMPSYHPVESSQPVSKRRASPQMDAREASRRRHYDPSDSRSSRQGR